MIEQSIIKQLTIDKIKDSNLFLVDITVDINNNIKVFIDSKDGIDINTCVDISKHIEQALDRDKDDFSIEVSSPGIGEPFKVKEQYEKVLGKFIEVLFTNGEKLKGELFKLNDDDFTIKYSIKEKPEGAKRPKMVEKEREIKFNEIKSTKEIIVF
jgi:ribosome maturation factor RimP